MNEVQKRIERIKEAEAKFFRYFIAMLISVAVILISLVFGQIIFMLIAIAIFIFLSSINVKGSKAILLENIESKFSEYKMYELDFEHEDMNICVSLGQLNRINVYLVFDYLGERELGLAIDREIVVKQSVQTFLDEKKITVEEFFISHIEPLILAAIETEHGKKQKLQETIHSSLEKLM